MIIFVFADAYLLTEMWDLDIRAVTAIWFLEVFPTQNEYQLNTEILCQVVNSKGIMPLEMWTEVWNKNLSKIISFQKFVSSSNKSIGFQNEIWSHLKLTYE